MRSGVRRHGRPVVPVLAAAGVALLGAASAAPFLSGGATADAETAGCATGCCHVPASVPGDTSPAAFMRRAAPFLTPLGGGLLVLAHLVNLFARPRAPRHAATRHAATCATAPRSAASRAIVPHRV